MSRDRDPRIAIEQAMVELCVERGFRQLVIDDLIERADVDRQAFDANFADLEDCFCEILERMRGEFMRTVTEAALVQSSWRDQIRSVAYAMFRFWFADRVRARYMMIEAFSAGERAQLIRDQAMDGMIALVDLGRNELADPGSRTRQTAEAIAGTMYSQMQRLIASDLSNEDLEGMVPELMHAVVLPYLGPEAAAEELRIPPPPAPDVPTHSRSTDKAPRARSRWISSPRGQGRE